MLGIGGHRFGSVMQRIFGRAELNVRGHGVADFHEKPLRLLYALTGVAGRRSQAGREKPDATVERQQLCQHGGAAGNSKWFLRIRAEYAACRLGIYETPGTSWSFLRGADRCR